MPHPRRIIRRTAKLCLYLCLFIGNGMVGVNAQDPTDTNAEISQQYIRLGAEKLSAKYLTLTPVFDATAASDEFTLETTVNGGFVTGDVYARVPHPITRVRDLLSSPANWCKAAIFNINVKTCTFSSTREGVFLQLYVADQDYSTPEDAYAFDYAFHFQALSPDYFYTQLAPVSGALDTRSYTFDIEAVAAGDQATFVRFNYSSQIGIVTRSLLSAYLATLGRHKVGFTRTGTGDNGEPVYINGIAGTFERNIMRYYFAFEAYLTSLGEPAEQRHNNGLNHWYDFTLKYRRQLYEVSREEYLHTKFREYANQIAAQQKLEQGTATTFSAGD